LKKCNLLNKLQTDTKIHVDLSFTLREWR